MKQKIIAIAITAIVLIVSFSIFGIERIDAGSVGIKVNMAGGDKGVSKTTYVTGWVFYNTLASRIYEFPIHQQHIDYEETQIVTKGGFLATIKPSFNYSINSASVSDMFQNLRVSVKQMEQGWLKNAIIGSVNDVANRYTVDSIFTHREEFESDIVKECNKRVVKWFNISQLRTNIIPPEAITASINAKTKAIQEVQVAENQRAVAVAEAERKMAEARGDSAKQVIAAKGEAEAIRAKQNALKESPQYVELIKAQAWDGKLPVYMLGNGVTPFFNIKQ